MSTHAVLLSNDTLDNILANLADPDKELPWIIDQHELYKEPVYVVRFSFKTPEGMHSNFGVAPESEILSKPDFYTIIDQF